eukprot:15312887-Heterocapsa_arctica.AAC.1
MGRRRDTLARTGCAGRDVRRRGGQVLRHGVDSGGREASRCQDRLARIASRLGSLHAPPRAAAV